MATIWDQSRARGTLHRDPRERFWDKVERRGLDECWPWKSATKGEGKDNYGVFQLFRRTIKAHRVAYFFTYGDFPDEAHVLHDCDNPICCNPKHLFLGSNVDNIQDRVRKGRPGGVGVPGARKLIGERNPRAVLTEEIVRKIRARKAEGVRMVDVARELGLRYRNMSPVWYGKTWKHVV